MSVTRDVPVIPIPQTQPLTREAVNRVVADINTVLDSLWDTLVALDARITALEVKTAGQIRSR